MSNRDFRLISPFIAQNRRDLELADPAILRPTAAIPLLQGEWLELNTSYQLVRGTADPAAVPSWPVFAESGRLDTQTINKVPVLYLNAFEADTLIFDGASLTLGAGLEVANVTYGGLVRRGLQLLSTGLEVARVTRLPANNNGYLRFVRTIV